MGRLIFAEDIKARAVEAAVAMEEPWHSQFAVLVEWLVDKTFTAYDVEKVIEQLVTIHVEGHCPSESLECTLSKSCVDCYREIVTEIVRKGGE